MQPLSGMDSSFLYMETPNIHMHVGSVSVFEGSLKFEEYRDLMAERIHLMPRLRQRLVTVPFNLGKLYWIEDSDFNLGLHLNHIALPKPGALYPRRKSPNPKVNSPLKKLL